VAILLPLVPSHQHLIVTFPLRPFSAAIRTHSLKAASPLTYRALCPLAKRATPWLWNAAPILILPIFVAGWCYAGARFGWQRIDRSSQRVPWQIPGLAGNLLVVTQVAQKNLVPLRFGEPCEQRSIDVFAQRAAFLNPKGIEFFVQMNW
jgi:hypothetical protein